MIDTIFVLRQGSKFLKSTDGPVFTDDPAEALEFTSEQEARDRINAAGMENVGDLEVIEVPRVSV